MVAPDGAGPWPQLTAVQPRLVSCDMIGTSPPGPFKCGSATCSVNAVATPASKALPPFSRVAIPTAVAIQWVDVTTPKVPSISGLVVNGSGLILLIETYRCDAAVAGAIDHSRGCLPTGPLRCLALVIVIIRVRRGWAGLFTPCPGPPPSNPAALRRHPPTHNRQNPNTH